MINTENCPTVGLHDPSAGAWQRFACPREIIETCRHDEVMNCLRRVEHLVESQGIHALRDFGPPRRTMESPDAGHPAQPAKPFHGRDDLQDLGADHDPVFETRIRSRRKENRRRRIRNEISNPNFASPGPSTRRC